MVYIGLTAYSKGNVLKWDIALVPMKHPVCIPINPNLSQRDMIQVVMHTA